MVQRLPAAPVRSESSWLLTSLATAPPLARRLVGLSIEQPLSGGSDAQVVIELAKPNAGLLTVLAGVPAVVLPMKELRDGSFNPRTRQLGTGPFMVASHRQDEVWELKRNPYYWGRNQPKADRLTVRIMPDDAARVAGLKDGTVDIVNFDTPDAIQLLEGVPNVKAVVQPTTDYYRLDVNATTSIFRDPKLREALSLAIDRQQIADVALGGTSDPTAAVAPDFGVCEPGDMPYAEPDLERARQLVEEAGATGKTVSIIAQSAYKPFGQIAQVLQQNLEQIGLKVKVEQPDEGEMIERVYSGRADFDLTVSYFAGLGDPSQVLAWWDKDVAWNSAWYPAADAELRRLIGQSRTETDEAARKEAIRGACEHIAQNANLIPLVTKPVFIGYRSDKIGVRLPQVEAFSDPLRYAADFSVKGGG